MKVTKIHFVAFTMLAAASPSDADILHAVRDGIVYEINTDTLAASELVNTTRSGIGGLTLLNNTLFATDRLEREVISINLQTQAVQHEFDLASPNGRPFDYHTIASANQRFYTFDRYSLNKYERDGSFRRLVLNLSVDTIIRSSDFDGSGYLRAVDNGHGRYYRIDVETGEFTFIQIPHRPVDEQFEGMAYGASGTAWFMTDNDLYSLNTDTNSFVLRGAISGWSADGELTGLASFIPSPSSVASVSVLAAALVSRRRRNV